MTCVDIHCHLYSLASDQTDDDTCEAKRCSPGESNTERASRATTLSGARINSKSILHRIMY